MKLSFTYGARVAVLPAAALAHAGKATKKDLTVLLALAADNRLFEAGISAVAAAAGVSEKDAEEALSFWRGTGVLTAGEAGEETALPQTAAVPVPAVVSDRGLPVYSSDDLAKILEKKDMRAFIDECQRVFGKVFRVAEVSAVAGMVDYLGLDYEYVLLLLAHCARMEKKSIRYVEKTALALHDEGVTEVADLEEHLRRREQLSGELGKLREIFGIGTRPLSAKEKKMTEKWICEMKYGEEMLRRAYDCTVDATGGNSLAYANSVLERWYAAGYRTVEEVDKALADYKRRKNGGGSFDAEEFFAAALKKSYGEN